MSITCISQGKKRWRLYAPAEEADLLPRDSSQDFEEEELGKLLLDVTLHPGDLLYMPRGCIHQAEALPDAHSLHLTVSANQHCSWADLFELSLPRALQLASEEVLGLRRSLPFDMSQYMGLGHEGAESARRAQFNSNAQQLLQQVVKQMPLDAAADRMSVQFVQQRLPPYGLNAEEERADLEATSDSKVSMVRPGIATMTVEEDSIALYHCLSNPRILHAARPDNREEAEADDTEEAAAAAGRLEFNLDCGEALECILASHAGHAVTVEVLEGMLHDADVFEMLGDLYSEGLINVQ